MKCVLLSILATIAPTASCTVVNDIDVCEREAGAIRDVNRRTENDQYYSSTSQLVASTRRTWLTSWAADLDGTADVARSEIRIARLDVTGAPLTTCGEPRDLTVAMANPNSDRYSFAYRPTLITPRVAGDYVLLLWAVDDGTTTSIRAQTLTEQGCPSETRPPFPIHEAAGVCGDFAGRQDAQRGVCINPLHAVALDTTELGGQQYVALWKEATGISDDTIMARVFELLSGAKFLPTALDVDGGAVSLLVGAHAPLLFDAVALDSGAWALAWLEVAIDEMTVWLQVWNDRLQPQHDPVRLHRGALPSTYDLDLERVHDGLGLVFATEGDALQLVLTREDGRLRVKTELAAGAAPDWSHITSLPDGNMLVSWSERRVGAEADDGPVTVRSRLFDSRLEPLFNNPACDSGTFTVSGADGSAERTNVAVDDVGGALFTWTSTDAGGDDRSGSGIRSRYYAQSTLRP
jgi:hypothetical protein